ncbi:hypothetical protein, partial [Chthonobacter rhizosphaerae]|uniref:hypothetical protein n=1 Tax=Chthonobacter rhizosphaerae TaxID=2735553 RepID=UPI001AEDE1E9
ARERYRQTHDMNAVASASELSERLHEIMKAGDPEGLSATVGPDRIRLVLDIPKEWLILAQWLVDRRTDRHNGVDNPVPITEEFDRATMKDRKDDLWDVLHEWFHTELHWLATGGHPILKPEEIRMSRADTLDDDLPF